MTDQTKPETLHSGRFGEFSISGFFVQGYGICGKPRWCWVLALKESDSHPSDQEHRYLVCDKNFREFLEGDLSKGPAGAPSLAFDKEIVEVPEALRTAALEAISVWEGQSQPVEGRCLSRCSPSKKTDKCGLF